MKPVITRKQVVPTITKGLEFENWVLGLACHVMEERAKTHYSVQPDNANLSSPDHVRRLLATWFVANDSGAEKFVGLFLDNRHNLIASRCLFTGTIDSAAVYPREVVKQALQLNAAAIIFAHNHPSGTPEPSDADVRITRKLTDALSLIDVRVLDHIVYGDGTGRMTSLAERGLT